MAFSYKDYVESEAVKKRKEQAAQYETYNESQTVTDAYNAYKQKEANKIADWAGGTYGQSLKDQMDKINNREKFTYDLNGDALYQQYKDQYMNQGRLASADVMGQASAMTGGYGNSYAATVGNQAYQGYLQKLNDVVPELYNMAYNRYQQEGQDMKDMLAMYESAYGREYGEHRDKVSDYNTDLSRLMDIYYNEKNFDYSKFSTDRDFYNNAYNNERTYDYGQYSDAYNRAFGQYQQGVSEKQWQDTYDLQKSQADQSSTIESLKTQLANSLDIKSAKKVEDKILDAATFSTKAKAVTRGNRGNTGNGGYKYNGKTYFKYSDYVKEMLNNEYEKGNINDPTLEYLIDKYNLE